ncbi:MoaF C-terminal domain-containing protein [Leucobacter tenebrionis]|uniref:MoaF C-terminal domain-containing protein n=1 Tax=Leucobacter tenebrionis TaxID=2873270 RepID=UPI001CA71E93|nr:MoaF C-terminal domain-containing protein [Leucobacter tenebrionis]QZY51691.1 molybdenum cofactor biosynthesis F family protein [Leucobacter tenebrionis]
MTEAEIAEFTEERRGVDEWATYDEFAAGIDTYRLPNVSLEGRELSLTLDDGSSLSLAFGSDTARWSASGTIAEADATDPYDAVQVRKDVFFLNLPLESRDREAVTVVWSERTGRAIVTHSHIDAERVEGEPQVKQDFHAATIDGADAIGDEPGESRDLIGMRNLYRYSPEHLYEHVYMSTERYAWQNLQGVQRGHGDMDLSTVWKLDDGLYLFCFREFRISVASVWLHDLGYNLMTTGIFLGINGDGESEHSRAGGHIYPLGTVKYPDAQPV